MLAAIARYGLPDAAPVPIDRPLEAPVWHLLRAHVTDARLTGVLAAAIESGALPVTDAQFEDACNDHTFWMGQALRLERLLLRSDAQLRAAGIPTRVLKGAALAHILYPNPSLRCYGDLDILVPSTHYDAAIAALVAAGGTPRYDEPHIGFNRRFGKGVCIVAANDLELDVHRTFASGPFGLSIRLDELFDESTPFTIDGTALHALSPVDQVLHVGLHAAVGTDPPRWSSLRDVAQLLLAPDLDLDLDLVNRRAAQWRVGAPLARAIDLAWSWLELTNSHPLVGWARAYRPTTWERRALATHIGPRRGYAAQAIFGVTAVPGIAGKFEYLRLLALPDPAYVANREGSYWRRFKHGVRLAAEAVKPK